MLHQDSSGKTSSMRIGFITCLILGGLLILSGIVAGFKNLDVAGVMINAGAALCGSSGFAKSLQKKFENDNAS